MRPENCRTRNFKKEYVQFSANIVHLKCILLNLNIFENPTIKDHVVRKTQSEI